MPLKLKLLLLILFSVIWMLPGKGSEQPFPDWKYLSSIPDPIGYAAPFAGTSNDVFVVAGGANFPSRPPWEGGSKAWHDRIYVLEDFAGTWREVGQLKTPRAYGVSISTSRGIWCIGGSDASNHFQDSFLLEWQKSSHTVHQLPNALPLLPQPCANAAGVILDHMIYIAGGQTSASTTKALHTFWALDLQADRPQWMELPPWPGPPRIFATMATLNGAIYLMGGADLKPGSESKAERIWLRDAYRFVPQKGWQKLAELPRACVAAPSPAIVDLQKQFILIPGGDDGSQLQTSPTDHAGFPKQALLYDVNNDQWKPGPALPVSLVTTTVVQWKNHNIIPGGEVKPGIRSPKVLALPNHHR